VEGLQRTSSSDQLSWAGGKHGLVAAGFVLGIVSVGFGTFGQPHLLVRFMALRDERALRQARLLTIVWFCIVFFGMCFVGLAGRILLPALADSESVFFALSSNVLPPVLAAILVAAVLSAIMSTADSQLLVAASAVAHDLRFARGSQARLLLYSRVSVALMVALAVAIALLLPAAVFSRALFAWVALGAAFGPLTIARLANVGVTNYAALASVVTGFSSAVAIHVFIDSPAPMLQNLLPLSLAAACLVVGRPRTTDSAHPKAVVP
ncbi:MAG: sodium/proline symporter, partial [Pseudomonadota bacterium]